MNLVFYYYISVIVVFSSITYNPHDSPWVVNCIWVHLYLLTVLVQFGVFCVHLKIY